MINFIPCLNIPLKWNIYMFQQKARISSDHTNYCDIPYFLSTLIEEKGRGKKKRKKEKEQFFPLSVSTPILDRKYKPETNKRDNRPPSRKPFARVSITILVHRAYQRSNNLLPPSFPDYYTPPRTLPTRYISSTPLLRSFRLESAIKGGRWNPTLRSTIPTIPPC